MSRDRRRSRRRVPQKVGGTRTISLGWPIVIGVAVIAIIGLVAYLFVASGSSSSSTNYSEADIAAEADSSPNLPGKYVDLRAIYGGPYPATAGHVTVPEDYAAQGNSNPPAGGPHWSGNCGNDPKTAPLYCGPAPWNVYRDEWHPETLVHNMEHGGVVLWYNTTDQALISQMEDLVLQLLPDKKFIVMAPYSEMEPETVALTSWSRIDKFPVSEYSDQRVRDFVDAHVKRFNPEHIN